MIEIKANEIKIVPIAQIEEHEDNNNRHDIEQIEDLAEAIKETGFRDPLIISTLSGKLVSGHCRLAAAKKLNMTEIPVVYQEFKDENDEFSFLTAVNEFSKRSEFDYQAFRLKIDKLKLKDFNMKQFGIEGLTLDSLKPLRSTLVGKHPDSPEAIVKPKECPHCGGLLK